VKESTRQALYIGALVALMGALALGILHR